MGFMEGKDTEGVKEKFSDVRLPHALALSPTAHTDTLLPDVLPFVPPTPPISSHANDPHSGSYLQLESLAPRASRQL